MSYSISAYAVDLKQLEGLLGSKDRRLVEEIRVREAEEIAQQSAWFAKEIQGGAPTLAEALTWLIDGVELPAEHAFQYWYAVELLAKHLGERIDVSGLESIGYSYLAEVDEILGSMLGVPSRLHLTTLLERAPPLKLPALEDFPAVGYLSVGECEEVARVLEGVETDDLDADPEVLRGVTSYANMIDGGARSGRDVLFLYY